jgi:hypothetical protein
MQSVHLICGDLVATLWGTGAYLCPMEPKNPEFLFVVCF